MAKGPRRLLAKAIMFDIDGTLFDSRDAFYFMIKDVFAQKGWALPEKNDILRLIGRTNEYIGDALVPPGPKHPEAVRRWSTTVVKLWIDEYLPKYVRMYPKALEALTELDRRGFKLAIVTNGSSREIPLYLKQGGVTKFVDLVVTADDVSHPKPDPDILDFARAKLGVEKKDCVYVGDTWMDARAAERAGLRCVLVTWGIDSREELEAQTHAALVSSFDELLDLFTFAK